MKHLKVKFGVDPTPDLDKNGNPLGFFWPASASKRDECRDIRLNNPLIYESTYQCNPVGAQGRIFDPADFLYYQQPPGGYLEDGYGDDIVRHWIQTRGAHVAVGWDTAYSPYSRADFTAAVVGLLVPCTEWHRETVPPFDCPTHYDLYILDVYRQKVGLPDLLSMVQDVQAKWQPRLHCVEKKVSGISLIQVMSGAEINVEESEAKMSKRDRALKGVGAGSTATWFRQGRILFPDDSIHISWLREFRNEVVDFTGEDGGHDDQTDALVHLCNYTIMQAAHQVGIPTEWSTADKVDRKMQVPLDQWADLPRSDFNIFDVGSMIERQAENSPFAFTCGYCRNYDLATNFCSLHEQKFVALDSCRSWTSRTKRDD